MKLTDPGSSGDSLGIWRYLNPITLCLLGLLLAGVAVFWDTSDSHGGEPGSLGVSFDPKYDRLDGTGKSGKKVDVIEWEGNLEIHVYPGGSLKGLALKLDDREQNKKVMVIGYRFDSAPAKQLVRRNILTIPIYSGFQVYRDPSSGSRYDKIVITNNRLGSPLLAMKLDPEPTQLYPEGHPMNQVAETNQESLSPEETRRMPAAYGTHGTRGSPPVKRPSAEAAGARAATPPSDEVTEELLPAEEEGSIRPFAW